MHPLLQATVSDELATLLYSLDETTELMDSHGRRIGTFMPTIAPRYSRRGVCNSPISDEELEQRKKEPGGTTLADIWKRLGRDDIRQS